MLPSDALLPRPRRCRRLGGFVSLGDLRFTVAAELDSGALKRVLRKWPATAGRGTIHLIVRKDADLPTQGYRLRIGPEVVLEAASAQGAFYGALTLVQLVDDKRGRLERLLIEDAPVLARRGVHFDLKTQLHRLEYLESFIEFLADHKINCILLEHEDKIRFASHPRLAHSVALTRAQVRRLVRWAQENFIEVIPLTQTLGHLEMVGRVPAYRDCMEWSCRELVTRGAVSDQLCPSHPKALRLVRDLIEEVCELACTGELYHVGGDETRRLGWCLRCAGAARNGGPGRLYLEHMKRVFEFVRGLGKRPVVWGDMFIHYPEIVPQVPRSVVIADWDYWSTSADHMSHVVGWRWGTALTEDLVKQLPREEERFWRRYVAGVDYPRNFRGFPFLRFFRAHGLDVMGVPAVRKAGDNYHVPENTLHVPNVIFAAKAVAGLDRNEGIIISSWAVRRAPWENTKFGILAGADAAWNPEAASQARFDCVSGTRLFGLPGREVARVYYHLSPRAWFFPPTVSHAAPTGILRRIESSYRKAEEILARLPASAPYNERTYVHLKLAARQCRFDAAISRLFAEVEPFWGQPRLLPDCEKVRWRRRLRKRVVALQVELADLRRATRRLFEQTILPAEVAADLRVRFGPAQDLLRRLRCVL